MKIIVLHGPGEMGKRAEALRIRKQFSPDATTIVDLNQEGIQKLEMALNSVSLFDNGPRLVVAENVSDKLDVSSISAEDTLTLLVIAGTLKATSLLLQSAVKMKAKVLAFEGEKELSVFPYLDYLMEQKKQALSEVTKLLSEYGAMYVLTMIYYGLRRNILPLPASPFARKKIEQQKKRFGTEDWENFYHLALTTEFNIKNGKIPEELGIVRLTQAIIED